MEKKISEMQFQNVSITLSNGKEIVTTVPAFIEEGERVEVVKVRVTNPRKLPDGYTFEKLET